MDSTASIDTAISAVQWWIAIGIAVVVLGVAYWASNRRR